MANWLNQLQSLLGQSRSSTSSSADQGLGKLLVPGALGGLAGLLVANKSARKLLTKYGTNALLVGGGAVAGTVLWNKYKDKIRAAHQDEPQFGAQSTPLDERTERLILALVFAAKSDGHIDAKERAAIDLQLREAGVEEKGRVLIEQAIEQPLDPQRLATGVRNEEEALTVPTVKRSFTPGSSVEASFCATSIIFLSWSIAASRQRMDFSRPTNKGMTMCG